MVRNGGVHVAELFGSKAVCSAMSVVLVISSVSPAKRILLIYQRRYSITEHISRPARSAVTYTCHKMHAFALSAECPQRIPAFPPAFGLIPFTPHCQRVEDNHLFDEVYEGPLMINDRVILSHEPIDNIPVYLFNIHGHDHMGCARDRNHFLNVCAEHIQYTPIPLLSLLKEGLVSKVNSIHRETINKAAQKKK